MIKKDGFGHERPNEGETNDWITPKWIIDAFNNLKSSGMFFDLDPCASINQPWPCARDAYTAEQDGLLQKWHGIVWCNPPYGDNVGTWARLMGEHNNGVMLIFARLETGAWQEIFKTADGFLFPFRRINFYEYVCECGLPASWHSGSSKKKAALACGNYRPTPSVVEGESAGAPSAFVAWGTVARAALIELCDSGIADNKNRLLGGAFLDRAFYTGSRQW